TQYFSAHWQCAWGISCDYSEELYWGNKAIEYPSTEQVYTRVFVAHEKHANYASRTKCNIGAIFGYADCTGNADSGRLEVRYNRNVGSYVAPWIDSTTSTPPFYSGTEYFWQDVRFCGWYSASVERTECSVKC